MKKLTIIFAIAFVLGFFGTRIVLAQETYDLDFGFVYEEGGYEWDFYVDKLSGSVGSYTVGPRTLIMKDEGGDIIISNSSISLTENIPYAVSFDVFKKGHWEGPFWDKEWVEKEYLYTLSSEDSLNTPDPIDPPGSSHTVSGNDIPGYQSDFNGIVIPDETRRVIILNGFEDNSQGMEDFFDGTNTIILGMDNQVGSADWDFDDAAISVSWGATSIDGNPNMYWEGHINNDGTIIHGSKVVPEPTTVLMFGLLGIVGAIKKRFF